MTSLQLFRRYRAHAPVALIGLLALVAIGSVAFSATRTSAVATPSCAHPTIRGTSGSDFIRGTDRSDVIVAGAGNDTIRGRAGNDLICGGDGDDRMRGGEGEDSLNGGPGNDILYGRLNDDVLVGGWGFDSLFGDLGFDRCEGEHEEECEEVDLKPTARSDRYSVTEDQTLTVVRRSGVLANDSDPEDGPLTAKRVSPPDHGTVTLHPNGSFSYTPDPDYAGADSFDYRASDGNNLSGTATVRITIDAVADPPVATPQAASTDEDTAKTVTLGGTDPDGAAPAVFKITELPAHGEL